MNKLLAAIVTLALSIGLSLAGVALPASAHTVALSGVAECDTETGTWTVTWTYNATNVPSTAGVETKVIKNLPNGAVLGGDGVLKGGQLFLSVWKTKTIDVPGADVMVGNWSKTFTQTGIPASAKEAEVMVQSDWTDGYSRDDSKIVKLTGSCKVDDDTIRICHATNSDSNPYTNPEVNKNSIVLGKSGHTNDPDDIIPPFTYVLNGGTGSYPGLNWTSANEAIWNAGCDTRVTPVAPVATAITTCGTYGSISFADTAQIDYALTSGNGQTGSNTVTATAIAPWTLIGTTSWTFDLGQYLQCTDPTASVAADACYANRGVAAKDIAFTFDNSASLVAVTFSIAGTGISETLAAGATKTVAGGSVGTNGGSFDVTGTTSDGTEVFSDTLVVGAFDDCLVSASASATDQSCVDEVVTQGSIDVTLTSGITYEYREVGAADWIVITEASTLVESGTYDVRASAASGLVLIGDTTWTVTIADGQCSPVLEPVSANANAVDRTCVVESQEVLTDSAIEVDLKSGVTYEYRAAGAADWIAITASPIAVVPGDYEVRATAGSDYVITGQSEWSFTIVSFCIPPLAVFEADASATDETCDADGVTPGTITVVFPADAPDAVEYRVDSTLLTKPVTEVAPGTYTVTATATGDNSIIGPSEWELTIDEADESECGDLTTLALTGTGSTALFAGIAGVLVLLGGAALVLARRRSKAPTESE